MSNGHRTLRAVIDDDQACIETNDSGAWKYLALIDLDGRDAVDVLRGHGYELDEAAVENGAPVVYLRELPTPAVA